MTRLCQGGPDHGRMFHDVTREHFRSEYAYDHIEDEHEIWCWRGEDAKVLTAREELLATIHYRIGETTSACKHKFGSEAFSTVSLRNQIVCLQAFAYLVEQRSERHITVQHDIDYEGR